MKVIVEVTIAMAEYRRWNKVSYPIEVDISDLEMSLRGHVAAKEAVRVVKNFLETGEFE